MAFKTIGILGGMGPAASAKFYNKIIDFAQKKYGAIQDTDYPPMIIYSLPLKGFDETGVIDSELVLKQLQKGIEVLNQAGSDFIVITCNTIHHFLEELKLISQVPILSIMEETTKKIKSDGFKKIGLLASETTLKLNLYNADLIKENIQCILPEENNHKHITQLILEVMSGNIKIDSKNKVIDIIKNQQVKAIILGCTELPLAITKNDIDIKVYDTLDILAESAFEYSKKHYDI